MCDNAKPANDDLKSEAATMKKNKTKEKTTVKFMYLVMMTLQSGCLGLFLNVQKSLQQYILFPSPSILSVKVKIENDRNYFLKKSN